MEIGEFTVYFVQYRSAGGHWYTKNLAYATLEQAQMVAQDVFTELGQDTRVVRQTTLNTVI